MNEAGRQRAAALANREYSAIEYRNRLVRMHNMDLICHCSAEVDMGTLLYFSVNDMYLGTGAFVILLFSETSEISAQQQEGRDVFGRMYTYAIIEEICLETLTGRYSFYSSEVDGRLVMILNFPFGLMPDRSIVDYLDVECERIAARCRALYDMNVVTYVGEPIENIQHISSIYTKLLETATLHRYLKYPFASAVFHVALPSPSEYRPPDFSIRDSARAVVGRIVSGGDYHSANDEALRALAAMAPNDVDNLKRTFGVYFESICDSAGQLGIKMKYETLRTEQFHIIFDSIHWEEPVGWLRHVLDTMSANYAENSHRAARRQLDDALAFIEGQLDDPTLTIEKCASAAGCSVSALNKLFRRRMNTSVAKYIREARLERAMQLLHEGFPVGDTCLRCGFGSTETFHRAFKGKFGLTPGQIRAAAGNDLKPLPHPPRGAEAG